MTAASNKKKKKKQSFSCLPSWHVHLSWSAFWTPNPSSCKPVRGGNPFSFSQPCATFTEQLGSFFLGFFCFWIFRGSHLERISKNKKQKLCQTVQAEDLFTDLFSHSSAVAKADVKTKLHPFRSTTGSKASTIYLRVPAATAPSRGRIFCLQRTCEQKACSHLAAQFLQPFARPRRFALLWQKMPPFCLHHSSRLRGVHGTNLPYPGLRRLAFITQSVTHAVTLSLVTTLGHSHVGHPSAEMGSVSLPHSSTEISIWGYEKKIDRGGEK